MLDKNLLNEEFDIAIIGIGVKDVAHLTLEALDALSRCTIAFMISSDQHAVDLYRERIQSHYSIARLPDMVSLASSYDPNRMRSFNYADAADVIFKGLTRLAPVAYLTPGNPVVFDSVTQLIIKRSKSEGRRVLTHPGVSSIDTVLVDLQQELAPGLQVYEASWLVGAEIIPDPRVAVLLIQINVFCTCYTNIGRQPRSSALKGLKEYLLRIYTSDHTVYLVRSAYSTHESPSVHEWSLRNLDCIPSEFHDGASMYIPPKEEPVITEAFSRMMKSSDNLASLYEDLSD